LIEIDYRKKNNSEASFLANDMAAYGPAISVSDSIEQRVDGL
jgi:hypothetical protein